MGVSLLARELADAGHRVTVVHLNEEVGDPFDLDLIFAREAVVEAQVHALSFGSNHADLALELAAALGHRFPHAHTVCGGVHTTLNPEQVLASDGVDAVCIAEADGLLLQYVDALSQGHEQPAVESFWTKGPAGIQRNRVALPPALDNHPLPFFEGIDFGRLIRANRGLASVLVNRGCPKRCSYCHNAAVLDRIRRHSGQRLDMARICRQRPVGSVLEELSQLLSRFPQEVKAFSIADDTLVRDLGWLREFSTGYARLIRKPVVCNAHLSEISPEAADLLAGAGCVLVKLGVESGSSRVRDQVLRRPMDEEQLAQVVELLHGREISVRAYVMLGLPTETAAERLASLRLCARLRFDAVRPSIFHPYPGTRIYHQCMELGLADPQMRTRSYNTNAVLKLPLEQRVEIERTLLLAAWLMNLELGGEAAEASRPLLDRALAIGCEEWTVATGRERIGAWAEPVHQELQRQGVEHYWAPFADRPDAVFLYRRKGRRRPLPNIDDC